MKSSTKESKKPEPPKMEESKNDGSVELIKTVIIKILHGFFKPNQEKAAEADVKDTCRLM